MKQIFITNDIITNKSLTTALSAPPANVNQGTFTNAQLPQNILELSKMFVAMHVTKDKINPTALIANQDEAYNLMREKLLIAFPEMAALLHHEQLIRLMTAAVYQWANTYVPKTPVKVTP